jgi:N-methylhydantoinase A
VQKGPVREKWTASGIIKGDPFKEKRQVLYNAGIGFVEAKVFDRARLPFDFKFDGPALVEQVDTTTWVPIGWRGRVLDSSLLLLEQVEEER